MFCDWCDEYGDDVELIVHPETKKTYRLCKNKHRIGKYHCGLVESSAVP